MTESFRVPRVPEVEMTESSRVPRVLKAEMTESSRVPRVLKAEMTGTRRYWYSDDLCKFYKERILFFFFPFSAALFSSVFFPDIPHIVS